MMSQLRFQKTGSFFFYLSLMHTLHIVHLVANSMFLSLANLNYVQNIFGNFKSL